MIDSFIEYNHNNVLCDLGPGPTDEDDLYESFMAESTMVFNVVGDELVPVEEYWGKVLKHEMLQPKMVSLALSSFFLKRVS